MIIKNRTDNKTISNNPLLEIHKRISRYKRNGLEMPAADKAHHEALDILKPIAYK